ncbi:MAG: PHP domain-containing protein [Syntrophomonadaceae bacterium]|nr:PHP domain-containing protein [Syntrophomonadaceae bacterium]
MSYDLHIHTIASDGADTPQEVVMAAVAHGLQGMAITDHDTMGALAAARDYIASKRIQIEFIPGIELNTDYGEDEVHILGYYIGYEQQAMEARLTEIRQARYDRAEKMVGRLQQLGLDLDIEQVKALAQGELIGRPHIARALRQKGWVTTEEEAFARYIGRGQPAYVPRYKFTPQEAIGLVKEAGGISVLAHPGLIQDKQKILEVIRMGIEGLEVYYPEHDRQQTREFEALAVSHRLLITGGSDYHGADSSLNRSQIGMCGIDAVMMGILRDYHRSRSGLV